MTIIPTWSPALSVRNPEVDAQHITLLELGRQLLDALAQPHDDSGERVRDLLRDIVTLSLQHDALEERLLVENGAENLSEHRASHSTIHAGLAALQAQAAEGTLNRNNLAQFITDWMGHHLSETDLPAKKYFKTPKRHP